ncbi:unnamed protein product [Allacma fusca]|uniref:Uncharacterized protein n=1 Tax=Allacma fusca TaxID=39272 RepID=A0A8J2K4J1_9HEXA|nr:unnamed protein product [Allacma fusca]
MGTILAVNANSVEPIQTEVVFEKIAGRLRTDESVKLMSQRTFTLDQTKPCIPSCAIHDFLIGQYAVHYQFKQKGNLSDIEIAIKDWVKAAPHRIKIKRKTRPSCTMTEQLEINGQSVSFSGDSSGHVNLGDE